MQGHGQIAVVAGADRTARGVSSPSRRRRRHPRAPRVGHGLTRRAERGRPGPARAAQRGDVLRQAQHRVLAGQGQHPVQFDPVGRIGRPLVQYRRRAQRAARAQSVETRAPDRRAPRAGARHPAVQIREVKPVQIPREHPVLLVGERRRAEKTAQVHGVVAKFHARGVVADKVRHLEHVAGIDVAVAATGLNGGGHRCRLPGGGGVLNPRAGGRARRRAGAVGKKVRAHGGAVQRPGDRGGRRRRRRRARRSRQRRRARVFGRQRNRLSLIFGRAHGDDFDVARLGAGPVQAGHVQAIALCGRHRAAGVGRGPGDGAVGVTAQKTRVHVVGRQHQVEVQRVHGVGGAAKTQLDHLGARGGVDNMQAGDPLIQHRVIGHQGQIAALVGRQRGLGTGYRGQGRGRHKCSG